MEIARQRTTQTPRRGDFPATLDSRARACENLVKGSRPFVTRAGAETSRTVNEVVQTIRANLKVDWTEAHREDVKAGVRSSVKRVLLARGVRPADFARILPFVMRQAEALYRDWPLVA